MPSRRLHEASLKLTSYKFEAVNITISHYYNYIFNENGIFSTEEKIRIGLP
jgi:hypothetical protein